MRRGCFSIAILGALIGLTGCHSGDSKPAASSDAQAPQEILSNFEMQDIRDGIRSMTLKAAEGRIFDTTQQTDLSNPLVTFYKRGVASSRLTAPLGRVYMKTHDVEAWGGVHVVTTDSSTLTTDRLHYDARTRKITSKDHVVIDKPDSITEGESLETDPELKDMIIGQQTVHMKHAAKH